jgi:hypothetical protein
MLYSLLGTFVGWNMKIALLCNLNITKVYIILGKYAIHYLNLCQICLYEFVRMEGGVKFMKRVKGVGVSYKSSGNTPLVITIVLT